MLHQGVNWGNQHASLFHWYVGSCKSWWAVEVAAVAWWKKCKPQPWCVFRVSKRLGFPAHICLVEGGQLSAYSLSKGHVHDLAQLPAKTASGQALAAQKLVHSQKKNACLIFFQSSPGRRLMLCQLTPCILLL